MNLKIGQKFPDIELPDHDGQPVKFSELVGKFPFILSFLPRLLVRQMPGAVAPLRRTSRRTGDQLLQACGRAVSIRRRSMMLSHRLGRAVSFSERP